MLTHIYKDAQRLTEAIANWIVDRITDSMQTKEDFNFLLSGGNTPKGLYQLLATEKYKGKIDWKRMHIFFGDERIVPFEDERNNGKMAYEAMLKSVPIPASQIHYIDTTIEPQRAALNYESMLREHFNDKHSTFDLSLLGMGDDGHTLSVFPGSKLIHEKQRWVASVFVAAQHMYRITLTPAVVNKSTQIAFLVSGSSKAKVLSNILSDTAAPHYYPAQSIQPSNGQLHWFVDELAFPTGNRQ